MASRNRPRAEQEMRAGDRDRLLSHSQQTDSQPEEPGEEGDLIAEGVFQEHMQPVRQRRSMNSERHNELISDLHWRRRVDVHEFESIFKLSKCTLKTIVTQRLSSLGAALKEGGRLSYLYLYIDVLITPFHLYIAFFITWLVGTVEVR